MTNQDYRTSILVNETPEQVFDAVTNPRGWWSEGIGLVPQAECYTACAPAWTQYIGHSLKSLITSGKGDPNLEGRRIEEVKPIAE
jgi:hypothetical protein